MATAIPLKRERNVLLFVLLALAAGAWTIVVWQSLTGGAAPSGGGTASILTMGMGGVLFLAIWVAMMAAMMFPAAAPMVMMFARVQSTRRAAGRAYTPTAIFVAGYLLVWATAGLFAFAGAVLVGGLADRVPWLQMNGPRISGGVLILAGLYQLTPLKAACLGKCRSPLSFVLTHWRDGNSGSFRMGLQHGAYCFGCCWLLFVLLFPLGLMNVAAMGALALLIFAEKSTAWGGRIASVLGIVLIAYGIAVVIAPWLLPGTPGVGPSMGAGAMGG
jgi:predicted metal-binding membrane protein